MLHRRYLQDSTQKVATFGPLESLHIFFCAGIHRSMVIQIQKYSTQYELVDSISRPRNGMILAPQEKNSSNLCFKKILRQGKANLESLGL